MNIAHFRSRLQKGIKFEIRLDDEEATLDATEAAKERKEEEEKVGGGRDKSDYHCSSPFFSRSDPDFTNRKWTQ